MSHSHLTIMPWAGVTSYGPAQRSLRARTGFPVSTMGDTAVLLLTLNVGAMGPPRLAPFQNRHQSAAQEAMRQLFREPGTDVTVPLLNQRGERHETMVTRAAPPEPRKIMPDVPPS